tara:strand:+ start:8819 stop:9733 length:915 start_codon:yes stop_codon:yes gene_type:complete
VWRLQGAKEEDATLFQQIANKGHYRKVGGSRQGIYVCSPSGKLLSSVNSLNPDVVIKTIKEGLEKWKKISEEDKKLPKDFSPSTSHRWEDSYPKEGLILKGAKADLFSDPPIHSERGDRWNMDYVWFSKEESRLWVPKTKIIGSIQECPQIIKDRLFRFHLVDNVRGQTLPFAPEEIEKANLVVKLTNINKSTLEFKISGESEAVAKGEWKLGENDWTPTHELNHSIKTDLLGSATYDINNDRFTKFEMVIIGHWKGRTQNNGRHAGPESGRIGILYNLAENTISNKIAPAFIDLYNAQWVQHP